MSDPAASFRPSFDMPSTPEQALAMLKSWSDPGCTTFTPRRAAAVAALLGAQQPAAGGRAVAWANVHEGQVRGLAFKRNDELGWSVPLTFAEPAVAESSRGGGASLGQDAMHRLGTVIRKLERDGDEHGVAEDLHGIAADFQSVVDMVGKLERSRDVAWGTMRPMPVDSCVARHIAERHGVEGVDWVYHRDGDPTGSRAVPCSDPGGGHTAVHGRFMGHRPR